MSKENLGVISSCNVCGKHCKGDDSISYQVDDLGKKKDGKNNLPIVECPTLKSILGPRI